MHCYADLFYSLSSVGSDLKSRNLFVNATCAMEQKGEGNSERKVLHLFGETVDISTLTKENIIENPIFLHLVAGISRKRDPFRYRERIGPMGVRRLVREDPKLYYLPLIDLSGYWNYDDSQKFSKFRQRISEGGSDFHCFKCESFKVDEANTLFSDFLASTKQCVMELYESGDDSSPKFSRFLSSRLLRPHLTPTNLRRLTLVNVNFSEESFGCFCKSLGSLLNLRAVDIVHNFSGKQLLNFSTAFEEIPRVLHRVSLHRKDESLPINESKDVQALYLLLGSLVSSARTPRDIDIEEIEILTEEQGKVKCWKQMLASKLDSITEEIQLECSGLVFSNRNLPRFENCAIQH